MADIARHPDFIDRVRDQRRKVERQRIAKPPRNTENFIMDPVVIRPFPPALAPTRGTILQVGARLGSGGPVTVSMYVVRADPPSDEPNPYLLHTFTDLPGDGAAYWVELDDPFDLELYDYYYPSITGGGGSSLTASFMLSE